VVPEQHDGGDQARKRDQRQRDTAMKSPCFRARPEPEAEVAELEALEVESEAEAA
jgi:hypothetical protein